jgi:hypothetical protein
MSSAKSKMVITASKLWALVVLSMTASLFNNAFGATIISSNTTWSGEIVLNDDVQIASGAVLTIAAGTKVTSSYRSIGVQGTLVVNGKEDSLVVFERTAISWIEQPRGASAPVIDINYSDIGNFGGNGGKGTFSVTNSIFRQSPYIWYPEGANVLRGNKFGFLVSIQVLINNAGNSIVIENNYFEGGGVTAYANYNSADDIRVAKNSFMLATNPNDNGEMLNGAEYPALVVSTVGSNSGMNAIGNYFGTTEVSEIESRILDVNDSLSRGVSIAFLPILDAHHPNTPANREPVVSINGGDRTLSDTDGVAGELITLIATAEDSDGSIMSTQWLVDGIEIANGLSASINLSNGVSEIIFRAVDNEGASTEAAITLSVIPPKYVPSDEWLAPYNGITSPSYLNLEINNIGVYDVAEGFIDSCMRINTGGTLDSIDGESFFDIRFNIFDLDEGLIRVSNTRVFNSTGALNEYTQEPDCSGTYETTTGIYSDTLQAKWTVELLGRTVDVIKHFNVQFEMMDSATLTLKITNSEELGLR